MRWRKYGENRSAELGANSEPCCLMSEETVDGIVSKNYSVEAWVKPSHYHHATLFGLMKRASAESYVAEHCVLIELCASPHGHMSTSSAQWDLHPGKFRYLYRSPAGFAGGESCFSRDVYALRKWQHMVACKTDDLVRLYIDGRLSDESQAPQNLTPELHILVGQLFPPAPDQTLPMRSYAGELDELALYDRELTPEEVKTHFNLAQPSKEKTSKPRREPAGPET
jgi:hypothetical protein